VPANERQLLPYGTHAYEITVDAICLDPAGEHTRSIAISTPSMASAGIMRFAKKKVSCLGCRQPLDDPEGILCDHCQAKARCCRAALLVYLHGQLPI
jgi:predicted metal-binding membrane protein